jgi:hypothetical protein
MHVFSSTRGSTQHGRACLFNCLLGQSDLVGQSGHLPAIAACKGLLDAGQHSIPLLTIAADSNC